MKPLFDIGLDLASWHALLDETGGEIASPESEAALEQFFAEIMHDEERKLDNYAGLMHHLDMEAVAAKAQAEQYLARAKARTSAVLRLKERVKQHLELTGRVQAKTATGRTFAIQKNSTQSLDVDEQADIPAEYLYFAPPVPDGEKIRAAIKAGTELPFARLKPAQTHLRLR